MYGRFGILVGVAITLAGCGLWGGTHEEGFKTIHVEDLAALRNGSTASPTVLDANRQDFRAREGIIPGATLLSSYGSYDVARELPAAKDARLVFYCADSH